MFRRVLLIIGVIMMATPLIWSYTVFPLAVFGTVIVLGLLCERYIYKPIRVERPGAGWDRTDEQFADPRSGQNVRVWFNPRTGERRYVAEDAPDHGV